MVQTGMPAPTPRLRAVATFGRINVRCALLSLAVASIILTVCPNRCVLPRAAGLVVLHVAQLTGHSSAEHCIELTG